jgi:exopolyphosphatase/guanosine-5'-triphosphate,3'-diphosphate pyrophosphatase
VRGRKGTTAPVLAALDLGTNNCRLLIARPTASGEFRIVDSFSRILRLGEGVSRSGELCPEAIERTIAALKVCSERIRKSGATHVRAIATAACRGARNAGVLVARAEKEAGIDLKIVTSDEEARLAAVGCAPLIGADYEGALIFDIGGGSTEIIWMRRRADGVPEIVLSSSMAIGVVTLAEAHASDAYETMRLSLIAELAPVRSAMDAKHGFDPARHHLLGTSGTVTTLAAIALGLTRYDRARVDASWHDCRDILNVVDGLVRLDHTARAAIGCVGADRADLILPGCAIFAAIHALWPCERLRVADRGLREGMLRELMLESAA